MQEAQKKEESLPNNQRQEKNDQEKSNQYEKQLHKQNQPQNHSSQPHSDKLKQQNLPKNHEECLEKDVNEKQQQNPLKRNKPKDHNSIQNVKKTKRKHEFCNGSIVFTLSEEYNIKRLIGSGIYGIVAAATNTLTNEEVAIKKIPKLFNNFGDTRRVLREIKVLEFLNHKNIISLKQILPIDDPQTFNEIYLCMEYMQFDLRRLIQSKTKITEQMIKYIMYQLLAAINFMHSADILHRDLKPENILMNKKCQLKLADMNLARKQTFIGTITDYVASRPYRAPQILIGSTIYTKSVDIWSIGCIFAQLLGKTIIFEGKDFIDQLKRFVAILGKPKVEYFPNIDRTSMQSLGKLISQIPDKEKVQWKYLMPNISEKASDLLDHMLTYDANARYSAEECLKHPYLEEYKKAPKIKCREIFDFSFDKIELNQNALRKAICQAATQFHQKKNQINVEQQNISEEQKIMKKIKPNES